MTNWETGHYNPGADAWQFLDGNFEIVVPGTIAEPFVDRNRFANGSEWEAEFVEFDNADSLQNIRFTLYYRVAGDEAELGENWERAQRGDPLLEIPPLD